jgi:uncharacterized protein YecA (UPF0149 family)
MPILPAFCDTCGTAFSSGIFVENSTNISFSGNKSGPCPQCGGMGHVPDGVFNFIGSTIEILSAPERTISELLSLARLLREARAKTETKEQVASIIQKELPALSLLAKILPENKSELYGFLGLVIAAIALYTQSPEKQPVQTIVNITQVVETIVVEAPQTRSVAAKSVQTPKQGRNEPCNCGSGSKYKKCCGALK